jgi:hypothetical protein
MAVFAGCCCVGEADANAQSNQTSPAIDSITSGEADERRNVHDTLQIMALFAKSIRFSFEFDSVERSDENEIALMRIQFDSLAALTSDGGAGLGMVNNILHYTQGPPRLSVTNPAPFIWDGTPFLEDVATQWQLPGTRNIGTLPVQAFLCGSPVIVALGG